MSISKREVQERKSALMRDLRLAHQHGVALPGEMALSQRELSAKYGLSMRTIAIELKKLIDEGVLYTVPRVGTFVGRPKTARSNIFLALFRYVDGPGTPNGQWAALQAGFEERIANLGGTTFVLDFETARRYKDAGEMIAPAGIFEFHDEESAPAWKEPGVPHVEFGELHSVHPGSDAVYFNNDDGGWKATRHLIALGHKKIAFMALHGETDDPGFFLWSKEREDGWRRALNEAGLSTDGLVFGPANTPEIDMSEMDRMSREAARELLQHEEITAVVAVNAHASQGLFTVLLEQHVPSDHWPAVVAFDTEVVSAEGVGMHIITALRLPWEDIGRQAAELLWQRACGRLAEPEQRLVPMTLIPRLSCRQEWHRSPQFVELVHQKEAAAV